MSKLIIVCTRHLPHADSACSDVVTTCEALSPDNIEPNPPHVTATAGLVRAVFNPTHAVDESDHHLLIGQILRSEVNWRRVGQPAPDGTFALLRYADDALEVVTDAVASRTVWYYHDRDRFIASSSQRAIVMLLKSFEFSETVVPWSLSTGALGPTASWDRRLRRIPPNSTLTLDREAWRISLMTDELQFMQRRGASSLTRHNDLGDALQDVASRLECDWSQWVLPLSGGADSRALLNLLSDQGAIASGLRSVTWGLERSLHESGNDAEVAQRVAQHFSMPNSYLHTDPSHEPASLVLDRFLRNGEGRIAHLAGYLDGMGIWAGLFREGVAGTIRGDHAFGGHAALSPLDVRLKVRMSLLSDIDNLKRFAHLDWPEQEVPLGLQRRDEESLATWRDRLRLTYEIPTILAALSDIKLSYGEQVSPFLARRVLDVVLAMHDAERTEKRAFTHLSKRMGPPIGFATAGANASTVEFLKNQEITNLITESLESTILAEVIPGEFLGAVHERVIHASNDPASPRRNTRARVRRWVPPMVEDALRRNILAPRIDWSTLGLRLLVVHRMIQILDRDSRVLTHRSDLSR